MLDLLKTATQSICLVTFHATPIIYPEAAGSIGGAETQAIIMARMLGKTSTARVVVVVRDSCVRPELFIDGFTVVTWVDRLFRIRRSVSERVSILRSFPWLKINKWNSNLIWQIPRLMLDRFLNRPSAVREDFDLVVSATDCDTFCCMGVSDRTRRVFEAARKKSRRTILFVVSNSDLDPRYAESQDWLNCDGDAGRQCAAAIEHAETIVCQTETQQDLLKKHFGRESCLFPNPFDCSDWQRQLQRQPRLNGEFPARFVLWIGRSDHHHKRPHLMLEVALKYPEVEFVMIMNTQNEDVAAEIRSRCPPNLRIVERVDFQTIPAYFRQAAMFVSTGSRIFEGFPNVFLQAAATSVPVVTLDSDPGFISRHNAGAVCNGSLDQFASEIVRLWTNRSQAEELGRNGLRYVTEHHSETATIRRLHEITQVIPSDLFFKTSAADEARL